MSLHEELLRQLLNAIEEGKKVSEINTLTNELKDICEELKKEKDNLIDKLQKGEELNDEETKRTQGLNDKYNSAMNKLNKLIQKIKAANSGL